MRDLNSSDDPSVRGAAMMRGEERSGPPGTPRQRDPNMHWTFQPRQLISAHKYIGCAKLAIAEDMSLERAFQSNPDFGRDWSKDDWEKHHRQAGDGVINDYAIVALIELAKALVDDSEAKAALIAHGVTLARINPKEPSDA